MVSSNTGKSLTLVDSHFNTGEPKFDLAIVLHCAAKHIR